MDSADCTPSPRVEGALELLVVQSTPFCNIDCSYCYLPTRTSKARMSDATLERLFRSVFASSVLSSELTILWHAGEPLVLGIEYYERALALIEGLNHRAITLKHSIQTNATLLNQRWADFFRAHDIKLGISLDGPAWLHDRARKTRSGRGTHEQAMRGIRLMQANAIPFHVITVLTRGSLPCARELFDFYVENAITRVAFNIEEVEGGHARSSLQEAPVAAEVRGFFDAMMSLVEQDPSKLEVREFVGALDVILNPQSASYGNPQADPLRIISVGVNGELSTFSPELLGYSADPYGSFVFGNVHHTDDVRSILIDPKFIKVDADIRRGVERCRANCEYFEVCLGGAPANKLFENGSFDSGETMYCRLSKKAVIDVVLERVERSITI